VLVFEFLLLIPFYTDFFFQDMYAMHATKNNKKNPKYFKTGNSSNSFMLHFLFSLSIDVCKDSTDDDFSDTASSKTEGYAVLDVEYEVASSSDEDDSDNSSVSSGTDVS